jgi:maltose O-acetyltransferase
MRSEPSGTASNESSRLPALRDRLGSLHPRLLVLDALFGWVPSFVGNRARTGALRAAGIRIGEASVFFGLPTLVGHGPVESRLSVGGYCGFNVGTVFDLAETVTIGDHVAVGHEVMFLTSTHSVETPATRAGVPAAAPIVVGNGVWLGARSVILPGVTVGAGSVIAAGVTVSQNVPENTLLTGGQQVNLARWRQ